MSIKYMIELNEDEVLYLQSLVSNDISKRKHGEEPRMANYLNELRKSIKNLSWEVDIKADLWDIFRR